MHLRANHRNIDPSSVWISPTCFSQTDAFASFIAQLFPRRWENQHRRPLKFSQVLRSYRQSLWKNIQAGHTRSDLNGGILQILKDSIYKLLVIENYQLPKKHWRLKLLIRSIDVWQPLGQCQFHQLLTTFNHSRRPHVHQRPDCPTEWCGHLCEWLQKQNAPPATSNVPPPF